MDEIKQNLEHINIFLFDEFKRIQILTEFNSSKSNYHLLSEKGKYLLEILNFHVRLNKLLDDLNMVEVFISTYPVLEIYKESKINEINFINYHLEVFYHKISTISDVMKLFIAQVFELGICPKECNWENLQKRKSDIPPDILDVIQRYYDSFKLIIKIRNLNTHRSINVNPSSNEISSLLFLLENSDSSNNESKIFICNEQITGSIEKHKRRKVEDIRNAKEIADKYVDELKNKILIEAVKRADNK